MKEIILTIKFKVKEEYLNHKFLAEMREMVANGEAAEELSEGVPITNMSVTLEENEVAE